MRMRLNKVKGVSCEDGLLYHGEAETISAVAAPAKVSASRRVGKIEAQSQQMLQLRREKLVAEKKLFNNITCNHIKPSSHISQLHPFDACSWTTLPNYGTDAHWIPSGAIVGANNDWPRLFIARSHCWAATRFHTHPRRVICRQLSHAWKVFYCQSSNRLSSWLVGQLDCRRSPACAWKPEANQCGFASAASALE
ncbi:hypothetical protein O181_091093 [Austropuccinia psidii MF-1]|uniref:Uncharacterized protein n=1 Tax=Austropuccinia psidii MF-1 TaxID=1389203 RepID=A0A9Q3IW62_9BASI|nr:hypothetical protein [Austropuccinia psidii MF-1]